MLAAQRRDLLLDRLRRDGRVVAKDLAVELGVSEDSVRRDLRELAAAGLCQRVYGGALPVSPAIADHAGRERVEPASKERVAAAAARLVEPGSTAIIDGGTTALAVVRALPLMASTMPPSFSSSFPRPMLLMVVVVVVWVWVWWGLAWPVYPGTQNTRLV